MVTSASFSQKNLSAFDFFAMQDSTDHVVILDVRIYEKYKEDRIPGALYAGEKSVLMEITEDYDSQIPLLIYCKYGERSKSVISILENEGFKKLYHLKRGYIDWKSKGFPVDNKKID